MPLKSCCHQGWSIGRSVGRMQLTHVHLTTESSKGARNAPERKCTAIAESCDEEEEKERGENERKRRRKKRRRKRKRKRKTKRK